MWRTWSNSGGETGLRFDDSNVQKKLATGLVDSEKVSPVLSVMPSSLPCIFLLLFLVGHFCILVQVMQSCSKADELWLGMHTWALCVQQSFDEPEIGHARLSFCRTMMHSVPNCLIVSRLCLLFCA